jgi:hypothetical protein
MLFSNKPRTKHSTNIGQTLRSTTFLALALAAAVTVSGCDDVQPNASVEFSQETGGAKSSMPKSAEPQVKLSVSGATVGAGLAAHALEAPVAPVLPDPTDAVAAPAAGISDGGADFFSDFLEGLFGY